MLWHRRQNPDFRQQSSNPVLGFLEDDKVYSVGREPWSSSYGRRLVF